MSENDKPPVNDLTDNTNTRPKLIKGFALLSPERRKAIAAAGGKAVPEHKRSFSQDRDLAANAGRKGGASSHAGGRPKKVVE